MLCTKYYILYYIVIFTVMFNRVWCLLNIVLLILNLILVSNKEIFKLFFFNLNSDSIIWIWM